MHDTAPQKPANNLVLALVGLGAGAVGVWALDRIDWAMWNRQPVEAKARTIAARPGGEPPAQALVTKLEDASGTELSPATHETASQIVHYAIGMMPAALYALQRDRLPGTGAARGALYGLGLFLGQDEGLNTVTGLGGKPGDYPWQDHARGLVAHVLYGIVVELVLNRVARRA